MNNDEKMWVAIVGIICVSIITLTVSIFVLSNERSRIFTENGYTRKCLPGYSCPQWVKDEGDQAK